MNSNMEYLFQHMNRPVRRGGYAFFERRKASKHCITELFVPLAEQPRQRSAKPFSRVQLPDGTPAFALRTSARRANFRA